MTDTTMARAPARPAAYAIEGLTEPGRIRAWLEPQRAYAAYALAQLEPSLFGRSEWWTATGPGGRALVTISRGGLGNALLTLGDPQPLDAVLSLHPGPRYAFATFRPEHLTVIKRYYHLTREALMVRMAVTAESFRPVEGEAERLRGRNAFRINRLYSAEGGPTFYSSRHLEDGVYYGVYADGRLAAIAGTHVVSPAEGIAVVGNVFTHPRYRNRGLATVTTGAVTEALLQTCPYLVLTVESTNRPALRIYEKLGYREVCTLYETPLTRREPLGLLVPLRRLLAHWRGRRERREVVIR